jgi:hypothetical protein
MAKKRLSDAKILALLEMLAPVEGAHHHINPAVGYETAKEWALELMELRSENLKLKQELKALKSNRRRE